MPRFPVPEGESEDSWFVKEVEKGLAFRYPEGIPDRVRKQADFEVGVITQMGFPGYFLVVADFINWAKDNGIRVGPGRGSGAGSIAAYAMRITDLDPLEHGLIFERFLNPDRVSMPDFDIDFDERRRGEVIRYVSRQVRLRPGLDDRHLRHHQGQAGGQGLLADPRLPASRMGDRITKAMPAAVMGKDVPLKQIFDPSHPRYGEGGEFRSLYEAEHDVKTVVDTAIGIEGLKRQWGVHAAGVIMSSEPLLDVIPIMRREQDGAVITQFDYPTCESLGLIKMDFLGLRNLTVLDDALRNIESNRGEKVVLEELELTDDRRPTRCSSAATPSASSSSTAGRCGRCCAACAPTPSRTSPRSARSTGRARWAPTRTTSTPAARPAGSRSSRSTPSSPSRSQEILGETYGLIVYQEQVMAIAQKLAGYSLGQADLLRRAMGKKKKAELDKQFENFSAGMTERGYSMAAVKTLWDILLPFSDYAFNKAHSAAYGLVSYWTAYLKANYPAEYMAALLTSTKDDKDKSAIYLNECRRMGIKVLPPDVNESDVELHPGRHRRPLRAQRDPQRRRQRRRVGRDGAPGEGPLHRLRRLPVQGRHRSSATSGSSSRWSRPGRSTRSTTGAGRWSTIHEAAVEQYVEIKRNEAIGQDSLFGGLGATSAESAPGGASSVTDPRHRRVGQADAARPRARHARPLRLRPPADGARAHPGRPAPTARSASC